MDLMDRLFGPAGPEKFANIIWWPRSLTGAVTGPVRDRAHQSWDLLATSILGWHLGGRGSRRADCPAGEVAIQTERPSLASGLGTSLAPHLPIGGSLVGPVSDRGCNWPGQRRAHQSWNLLATSILNWPLEGRGSRRALMREKDARFESQSSHLGNRLGGSLALPKTN